jgi:hypothetical protein
MKQLYYFSFATVIFFSCGKSNKPPLSVTEQNLTSSEWRWRYTDTVTLQGNEIINSVYKKNNGCGESIFFHTNGTYDETNPCNNPTESDIPGRWKLINDTTLSLGFSPMRITKLTEDTLQFVTVTLYFEKSNYGVDYIDSTQTRETYSH